MAAVAVTVFASNEMTTPLITADQSTLPVALTGITLCENIGRRREILRACELLQMVQKIIQILVKGIRDLLFSRGPSVARQPHLPRKQALAQQPADELNPELINRGVYPLRANRLWQRFEGQRR